MADTDLSPDAEAAQTDLGDRDEATSDMFGAPAAPAIGGAYTVIARKYRPKSFDDLIGQEAMVRTLKNAFATGRIADAFMLTGVRRVGKTPTARLLAPALNYESETGHEPSIHAAAAHRRHCR